MSILRYLIGIYIFDIEIIWKYALEILLFGFIKMNVNITHV